MSSSEVVKYAFSFIGTPYLWGGNNPITGMDCSGLVSEVLKAFGVIHYNDDLSANDIALRLAKNYERCEPKEGAILLFGHGNMMTHVAIAIDEKLMIESGAGDSAVTSREMAGIKNAFVRIRPILHRKDYLFGFDVFKK